MKLLISFDTKLGTFYVGQSRNGMFHPILGSESLGSYSQIWQATEALAGKITLSADVNLLLDTSQLGIPEDPCEWDEL